MKTIYAIAPVIETPGVSQKDAQNRLDDLSSPDVKVVSVFLDRGPSSVENELDEALCIPNILEKAMWARCQGAAGIIVDCMADPGVKALRVALDIPVIGPAETAFHIAASLGSRFGILDIGMDTGPMVRDQVDRYGLGAKFAGLRSTGIAVEEIAHDPDQTVSALTRAASLAVLEDGADVLVFGCTGFMGVAKAVRQNLLHQNIDVPVIDPMPLAVRTLIAIINSELSHSKRAFPKPHVKKSLRGYDLPDLYTLLP